MVIVNEGNRLELTEELPKLQLVNGGPRLPSTEDGEILRQAHST